MQHLLFVKLKTSNDVSGLITAMSNSNLCVADGVEPKGFKGCNSSCQ